MIALKTYITFTVYKKGSILADINYINLFENIQLNGIILLVFIIIQLKIKFNPS